MIYLGAFAFGLLASSAWGASPDAERADQLIRQAMELDRRPQRGGELYARHCASCHGPQAHGDVERFIPALAAQRQAYLVKQLADFAELQRDARTMHDVVSRPELNDPQAWADLAAWLNAQPPAQVTQTGQGSGVALGEAIFREQCASCHDEDARGDDDGFAPSLRNQHYAYLVRQMHALGGWRRLHADPELVRFLDSLDAQEREGLADYLSRVRGPIRDRARMHQDGTVGD
jgi:cytochrome c553